MDGWIGVIGTFWEKEKSVYGFVLGRRHSGQDGRCGWRRWGIVEREREGEKTRETDVV